MTDSAPRDTPGEQNDEGRRLTPADDGSPVGQRRPEAGSEKPDHDDGNQRDVVDLASSRNEEDGQRDGEGQTDKSGDEDDKNPPAAPPKLVFIVAALIVLALVAWGGFQHWRSYKASKDTTAESQSRIIEVRTAEAKKLDQPVDLTLPGETQAFDTANVYPRATGYVTQRDVDIGSRVKQGDLLIHISAPDLDQQLAQAEAQIGQTRAALVQAQAQVTQAEATLNLAKTNFARTDQLTQQGYATQQNRDQQQANLEGQQANIESAKAGVRVGEANVKAQEATIDRLKALTAFEDVRAPFDGIVTARNVDVGELVNADVSTGPPMFTLVHDKVIRVMVRIPQNAAEGVHDGLEARVSVPQMPDRSFAGRVQRSSVALLYSSRTLTTEVDVQNSNGDLRPGLYVSVSFAIPRVQTQVNVPAEALIFNQAGLQVATVEDGAMKLHKVNIFRDHGTSVDLREGLQGGERIVLNPPAVIQDGMKVKEMREEDDKKDGAPDKGGNTGDNKQAKADASQGK